MMMARSRLDGGDLEAADRELLLDPTEEVTHARENVGEGDAKAPGDHADLHPLCVAVLHVLREERAAAVATARVVHAADFIHAGADHRRDVEVLLLADDVAARSVAVLVVVA